MVLAGTGEQDLATPPDLVRSLTDTIPGAQFQLAEDAGHFPSIEQSQSLVMTMNAFLEENDAVYAGVPAANRAFSVLKKPCSETNKES